MRPSLWAKFSSGIIDVFCHISTFSIAMVGISAINILRNAFARGGSTPFRSKIISSEFSSFICISECLIKCFIEFSSSVPVLAVKLAGCSNVLAYIIIKTECRKLTFTIPSCFILARFFSSGLSARLEDCWFFAVSIISVSLSTCF